jgi:general secretion pathway protein D
MNRLLFCLILLHFSQVVGTAQVEHQAAQPAPMITELDLRGLDIATAARLLGQLTGQTIVVSQSARPRTVDLSLTEASLGAALKAICRSADLVYRFDAESGIYTIMELNDYQKSASGDAEGLFVTETFQLEPANLRQIAYTIENLYGDRVYLTEGETPENFAIDLSGGSFGGGFGGGFGGSFSGGNGFNDPSTGLNNSGGAFGGQSTSSNNLQTTSAFGGQFGGGANRSRNGSGGNAGGGGRNQGFEVSDIGRDAALDAETARISATGSGQPSASAIEAERRARTRGSATIFITTNQEHNLLIVRTADRAVLKEIGDLVRRLNQPVPQVILEMKVLQLDVGDGVNSGVNWRARQGDEFFEIAERDDTTGAPTRLDFLGQEHELNLGSFGTNDAATFAYEFISTELRARVELLASDNRVEVVATPLLIAANNRSAQIRVGEERIITVGASSDSTIAGETGARNERINIETERRTIGTTVRIIPRINQDNTVTLNVQQEATTLKPQNNSIQVDETIIPIDSVDVASVQATVVAKDGHTVAVGGLIRNEAGRSKTKVPVLGDVPYLGRLFRDDSASVRKTELILLITPRLLNTGHQNGGANAAAVTRQLTDRLSDHRYHLGGDAIVEQDNSELSRYRAKAAESYKSLTGQPTEPPKRNFFRRLFQGQPKPGPQPVPKALPMQDSSTVKP